MSSFYDTDSVKIISVTRNAATGEESTSSATMPARIEDTNRVINGADGKTRKAKSLIMVQSPTVTIRKGDRLQFVTIRGTAAVDDKEYEIAEVFAVGAHYVSHYEVLIDG